MSGATEDTADRVERELRMDQMRADIRLKTAQASTEWPRFWVASLIAVAAVVGAVFSAAGFIIGQSFHR